MTALPTTPADRRPNGRIKAARRSHVGSHPPARAQKSAQRSRITNGSALVLSDNRSAWARRAKDCIAALCSDAGGVDNVSTAELSLIRRAAALTVELELMESIFAKRGSATAAELDLYGRTSGNLRRLLETLGLKRRPKNITPTLSDALQRPAP